MPDSPLGRAMRALLLFCGPMNVAGAISFSPPVTIGREALGLPEPPPFYLWVLATWVLAFGGAYFYMGLVGRVDRVLLAVAVVGKGVFGGLLIGMSLTGELKPFAILGGLPDATLALVFAVWLWRTRGGT